MFSLVKADGDGKRYVFGRLSIHNDPSFLPIEKYGVEFAYLFDDTAKAHAAAELVADDSSEVQVVEFTQLRREVQEGD